MRGRITGLTVIIILLFGVLLSMAWFVQVHKAAALNNSPYNPRIYNAAIKYPRGEIIGANGVVLARSIPTGLVETPWRRSYPLGYLTADVVGYSSNKYGTGAIEYQYNHYLVSHQQPARSNGGLWAYVKQLLSPVQSSDSVQLSLEVPLQQIAARALAGRDGAVVALDPRNGSVLAMYSNPTYNPAPLTSTNTRIQNAAWKKYTTNDAENFPPLGNLATQQTFPPGSTFKVVTTSAIYRYFPALESYSFPYSNHLSLEPYSNKVLYNSGFGVCGGTILSMLPASCDPGYGKLGQLLGGTFLHEMATEEGYNARPPLDLGTLAGNYAVAPSYFPPVAFFSPGNGGPPALAYSAIGQQDVRSTALQDALVAAGIANGGKIMAPHFMQQIVDAQGNTVLKYHPWAWRRPIGPVMASSINQLMQAVVTGGTASGVGFLSQDQVAAKTGTAQTGNSAANTDDWMIAFAPASHPVIAVAVVVPFQSFFDWGATVAGPIVKCVIEGALAIDAKQPPTGTADTCPR